MMADRRTTITIGVIDQYSRPLQGLARELGNAEKATDKLGRAGSSGGGLARFGNSLLSITKHAGAFSTAFMGVFKVADGLGDMAISAQRSEVAFTKLA
ncbi:MAG: hypothetical protein EHM39_13585, partial [Chloroflexi bacterium]